MISRLLLLAALAAADDERLRRVPPTFDLASESRFIKTMASELGLKVEVKALAAPRVQVSGSATFEQLRDFLDLMSRRDWRAGDVETLSADGTRFTARIVLPVLGASVEDIDRLDWRRMRDALALIDAGQHDGVHVTAVRLDADASIEGVLVGVAARKALVTNVERAGLGIARLRMSPRGACRSFAVTARRGKVESQTTFDLEPSALCRVDPEPAAGRIAARGSTPDGLSLHFRDIDLADLFFVLHDLTGESFIVDHDVKGAVEVDVEQATLEEVLAAIHRVSKPAARPAETQSYTGDPISFLFADANLGDVLCLFGSITSLELRVPANLSSRANVFVRDRPWDESLARVIAAAGLRYRIDGTRVLVGENATTNACELAAKPSAFADRRPKLEELGAADLMLAGVAGKKAYAYGPWRRLLILESGARVFDGKVQSISRTGVRFAMDGGLVFDLPLQR